ncbi:MAG: hypothetical protein QW416_06260 [Candidatus Nitrosocaldaceae archaeon]
MAQLKRDEEYKDIEKVIDKISRLEEDNIKLRKELTEIRRRGQLPISIILLSLGALSLIVSYIYEVLILTFIGLGLILFGAVIFYSLPSRFISDKALSLSIDATKSLVYIIQNLGYKGRAVFLYPNTLDGLSKGIIFIPVNDGIDLPNEDELAKMQFMYKEGIAIPSHANSIIKSLEETLNINLIMVDIAELNTKLKQFFVDELRVIDDINIKVENDEIMMNINGKSASEICRSISMVDKNNLGCPFCASVAFMISKITGSPVIIEENRAGSERIKTRYLLLRDGV